NYADTVPGPVGTWMWTGSDWKLAAVHNAPSPAPVSPQLVAGADELLYLDAAARLWTWNGATWSVVGTAPSSLHRGDDSASLDSNGSLLVFGGVPTSPPGGIYGDTWTWTAGNWTEVGGSSKPVAIYPP